MTAPVPVFAAPGLSPPGGESSLWRCTEKRFDFTLYPSTAIVQLELHRVGRHAEPGDLLHLEPHIRIDDVVGEDSTAREDLAILVEVLERHVERMAHWWNVLRLLGLEVVQVLVRRIAGMDLVLNAVEARQHHGREGEVRVCAGIREAHFDTSGFRVRHERNADRSGSVARGVREHHGSLEARDEALVAVGARVGEGVERLRMLDDAANVVERGVGKTTVLVTREERLTFLLQGLVNVHTAAVVTHEWFGHECSGLAVTLRDIQDRVLEDLHFVGLFDERAGADADLALAAGGNLVVMDFDFQAHLFQRETHCRADVLEGIDRWHGEVATLDARAVPLVAAFIFLRRVPGALYRIDVIRAAVHVVVVNDAVENEEFVLRTKQSVIGDARGLQIGLGALGEGARIALVTRHGAGLDDVAADVDRRLFEEGIDDGCARIECEDHVRFVDALPASDGGAVEHLAVTEQLFVDEPCRDGDVLLFAARVCEAQVRELDLFFFYQFDHIGG